MKRYEILSELDEQLKDVDDKLSIWCVFFQSGKSNYKVLVQIGEKYFFVQDGEDCSIRMWWSIT